MPNFKVVSSDVVDLQPGWKISTKFNSRGTVVDRNGKYAYTPNGNRYLLISKQERAFSYSERIGRGLLGLALLVCTVGLGIFSKFIRGLLTRSKETMRFAVLLSPQSPIPLQFSWVLKDPRLFPKPDLTLPLDGGEPKPPEPEPEPLPPLPSLLSLELAPEHELMQPFSFTVFIRELTAGAILAYNMAASYGGEEAVRYMLDTTLLDVSIVDWMKGNYSSFEQKALETERGRYHKQLIENRIALLENTIQFKERWQRIENLFPYFLKIKDLFTPWKQSPLRFALIDDEELFGLKLSDLKAIPQSNVVDLLISRIKQIKKAAVPVDSSQVTQENVTALQLSQLSQLNAEAINRLAKDLPSFVLAIVSVDEAPLIDVGALTDEQKNALWSNKARVQRLTQAQIKASIQAVKKEYLSFLSIQQWLELDFTQINQDIFRAVFATDYSNKEKVKALFHQSPLKGLGKIYTYFTSEHWRLLWEEDRQKATDLISRYPIGQDAFNAVFSNTMLIYGKEELLKKLANENIWGWYPYFSMEHWALVDEDKILEILPSLSITEELFKNIFGNHYCSDRSRLLKNISDTQLLSMKNYIMYSSLQYELSNPQKKLLGMKVYD